jgi:cell division protein DivIC
MKKLLDPLPGWVKNKYLVAGILFLTWMLFVSEKDMVSVFAKQKKLNNLKNSELQLSEKISSAKREQNQLRSDVETIEQYAREKYLMKKDNEDLFIIKKPENSTLTTQ